MSASSPAPRIGRLAMIGRRIRSGTAPFWGALSAVPGGQTALARRLGVAESGPSRWKQRGWVPEQQIAAVAAALDVPESWVPRRRTDKLRAVGDDMRAGVPFFAAVARHRAGQRIMAECGLYHGTVRHNWRRGIPPAYVKRVAQLIACPVELLPASRGCWRELTEDNLRAMLAGQGRMLRRDRPAQVAAE